MSEAVRLKGTERTEEGQTGGRGNKEGRPGRNARGPGAQSPCRTTEGAGRNRREGLRRAGIEKKAAGDGGSPKRAAGVQRAQSGKETKRPPGVKRAGAGKRVPGAEKSQNGCRGGSPPRTAGPTDQSHFL